MSSAVNALIPQLANYNPAGFAANQQLQQQQLGMNAAQQARVQQETALQQQQTQGAALQNQLVQQQIKDQKAIGAAWAQWDPNQDPSGQGLLKTAVRNGATPQSVMGVQQHLAQYNASLATADKTRLENQKMRDDDYAGKMQAIMEADPAQQEQLWQTHVADFAKDAPGEQLPPHFTSQDAKTFLNLHQFRSQQIENELKSRQSAEAAAGTTQKEAEAGKAAAEKEKLDLINERLKQGAHVVRPGEPHPIDGIFPASLDPAQNQYFKSAYDTGAKFVNPSTGISELQEAVVKQASEAASKIREANNPQIIAGKAETAKQEELARAPIVRENAIAQAKALREGDNPALVGVPPSAAAQAVGAAQKLDSDYIKAREATESMGKLLDLADQSNVAAGANIPMVGVGATNAINGIRRINSAEIAQYGSAGSLMQKIQGKLGGWTEGQPIPSSVRDDIRELHQQLGETAYRAYTQGIDSLNQRTGAKFGPTVPAPNIRKGAGGGMPRVATPADVAKLPKGTHFLDPNGIERIVR